MLSKGGGTSLASPFLTGARFLVRGLLIQDDFLQLSRIQCNDFFASSCLYGKQVQRSTICWLDSVVIYNYA